MPGPPASVKSVAGWPTRSRGTTLRVRLIAFGARPGERKLGVGPVEPRDRPPCLDAVAFSGR